MKNKIIFAACDTSNKKVKKNCSTKTKKKLFLNLVLIFIQNKEENF